MDVLPNVVVRFSSDGIYGETVDSDHNSTITEFPEHATATVCKAYSRDGKCGDCRACWDKSIQTIAYPQHGRKMARINIQLKAA